MIHSERTPICRLQFDKCVLADLNVDQRHISFIVDAPECFGKSQRLGIVRHRLVEIRYGDPHVVHADESVVRTLVLSDGGIDGQSNHDACNEQKCVTHKQSSVVVCAFHLPEIRAVSFSFSQTQSSKSVSGINSHPSRTVHGFL